jgi:3-oxoadipate enol-lactonase
VLNYDTRGHGGTDAPRGAYTLDQLADDAKALLGALGIQRTHWVGLSMGGMIGQTLALKAPQLFTSLVLCDTSSRIPPEAKPLWDERIHTAETKGMDPLVEGTLSRWFTAPFKEKGGPVVETVRQMIKSTPPAAISAAARPSPGSTSPTGSAPSGYRPWSSSERTTRVRRSRPPRS